MDVLIKFAVVLIYLKASSALIPWDSACGVTKGCFPDCPGGCQYLVKWQASVSNIAFELSAEESGTNVYLAIGYSEDYRMGDDSVVGCIVPANSVRSYFNEDTNTDELSNNQLGLTSTTVSQSNGVINCTFTRTYSESDVKYFDLNNDYIILLVVGDVGSRGGYKMSKHLMIPWGSDRKVDFNRNYIVDKYKLNSPLVKLHGIMMVLAWLLLVIVGIVTARYNKDMLPGKKLFGTKVWFQVHRAIMVMAVVFVIVGFIPIFVEIKGYSQITEQKSVSGGPAHPVLGIIATGLCFVNPIMALFRPGPDHKYRWIFNWAHFGVGVVGQTLAVVTIIIGYLLERANLSRSALWVTIAHLVVTAAVFGGLEANKWISSRKDKEKVSDSGVNMADVANGVPVEEKPKKAESSKPSNLPFIALVVFALVAFGLCIAVLAIIAAG